MQIMTVLWLIALVGFAVGEGLTVGLTSIWFAVGALGAMIVAELGAELWVQIVVFALVSLLSLGMLRPLAKKYLRKDIQPTNADRAIGQTAVVTDTINNTQGSGTAKVFGQEWSARSAHDVVIPAGTEVRVLRIEGVKLFVEAL